MFMCVSILNGATGRTRTDTVLLPLDFESSASTISPQWHNHYKYYTILSFFFQVKRFSFPFFQNLYPKRKTIKRHFFKKRQF